MDQTTKTTRYSRTRQLTLTALMTLFGGVGFFGFFAISCIAYITFRPDDLPNNQSYVLSPAECLTIFILCVFMAFGTYAPISTIKNNPVLQGAVLSVVMIAESWAIGCIANLLMYYS